MYVNEFLLGALTGAGGMGFMLILTALYAAKLNKRKGK